MKYSYGAGDKFVEVPSPREGLTNYNSYFGDPCPCERKYLKVEREDFFYYIPENTPLTKEILNLQEREFDWISYSLNYPELNLHNRVDAIEHYVTNKGWVSTPLWPKRGIYKVEFAGGLTNQLIALCHALVIGHYTGRDIYYVFFNLDNTMFSPVPLEEIIDVEHLNSVLLSKGYSSRLVKQKGNYSRSIYPGYRGEAIPNGDVINLLLSLQREKGRLLYLGSTFIAYEPTSFAEHNNFRDLVVSVYDLITEIRFTPIFYQEANKYKPPFPYFAVHLRAEDDFLLHPSIHGINDNKYACSFIHSIPKKGKVFLATYLGKKENRLNWILDKIKGEIFVSPKELSLPWKGREINAIVDYIICSEAEDFLGLLHSTFSLLLCWKRREKGAKYSLLINSQGNLWKTKDLRI